MEIIELSDSDAEFIKNVIETAFQNGQKVKVAVQGGLIIKRGGSVWTPPLGYAVDGNGDPI